MSPPLRVLVVDDEAVARQRAIRLLGAIDGVTVVGECASGEQALARLAADEIDVVLLDVQMPGLTGLDAKALMSEDQPYVIFATAHPEHAVRAFDVGADDYVLKPLEAARLVTAIERARKHLDRPRHAAASAPRLAIATRDGIVLVAQAEVSHATWDGALVTIFANGRAMLTDSTLQELEDKLDGGAFERVHRRAIVNLDHVRRLEPTPAGGYLAHTAGGAAIEVSRQAARRLRRRLGLAD